MNKKYNFYLLTLLLTLLGIMGNFKATFGKVIDPSFSTNKRNTSLNLSQQIQIHGRVTDASGNPIVGVTVRVVNSNIGTVTDGNGNYKIPDVPNDAILEFSSIGFVTQSIKVDGRENINVTLIENKNSLNALVVTGYAIQKEKDVVGAITSVNMKAMQSIPTGSATQALQGLAAGVNIIRTGQAGAPSTINIRGIGSFGNNQPLVLIDGVEGNLEDINPQDIQSISVLKDAGAAAIYGVRGSNGVILVTTRQGTSNHPTVRYNGYYSYQLPLSGDPWDLITNSSEYAKVFDIAYPSNGLFPNGQLPDYLYGGPQGKGVGMEGDPAVSPSLYNLNSANPVDNYLIEKVNKTGTDWFHEVFKPAPQQQHNISISGKSSTANYYFDIDYLNEQNTLIETYLKRYSVRINTGYNVTKNIRVGENAYLYYSENPQIGNIDENNTIGMIYAMPPIIPVYDIMGNFGGMFEGPDLGRGRSPVGIQKRTQNNINKSWNALGDIYLDALSTD